MNENYSVNDLRTLKYIWLCNAMPIGSAFIKHLFNVFGTIDAIFDAQKNDYKDAGLKSTDIKALCDKDLKISKRYLDWCKAQNIGLLFYEDPLYPERLKIIDNPPCMFFYRGRLKNLDDYPCFAFVGTRTCSSSGFKHAYETSYITASRGGIIVNGIARGIDGACIAGALDANCYAIAVLGCGIDRIYPAYNRDLFYKLSSNGLILSEFLPFTQPKRNNFPIRNRVISGLCVASVIFEADEIKSGAMITANYALKQGRQLFAVPGKPTDKLYSGPISLIKGGANVFTEADDILCEYSMMFPHRINLHHAADIPNEFIKKHVEKHENYNAENKGFFKKATKKQDYTENFVETAQFYNNNENSIKANNNSKSQIDYSILSTIESAIMQKFIESKELSPDEICADGIKIEDVLSSLTLLEVYGYIEALPGGRFKISEIYE